jgi:hypothetical protein
MTILGYKYGMSSILSCVLCLVIVFNLDTATLKFASGQDSQPAVGYILNSPDIHQDTSKLTLNVSALTVNQILTVDSSKA